MSVLTKVGTFTTSTSTGNQAITGVGFQPTLVMFWATGTSSDTSDSSVNFLYRAFGCATSSTSRWSIENAISGVNHSDQQFQTTKCIQFNLPFSDAAVISADFVSMNADGFTINNSTAHNPGFVISYMAFGGTGFSGSVGTWTATTSTGSQSVTGVGFQPKGLITAYAFASTGTGAFSDNNLSIGFASGTANQGACGQILTVNGSSSTNVSGSVNNACILGFNASAGNDRRAYLTSFDAGGFTLNWVFSPVASETMGYICLGGTDLNCKVVEVTKPTSTGTQAVTGLGFQPKAELFVSQNMVQSNTSQTGTPATSMAGGYQSFGAFDSTNYASWGMNHDDANSSASQPFAVASTTKLFVRSSSSAQNTTVTAAAMTSQDSGGFTLNWTQTDATASQIFAMAIGDSSSFTSTGTTATGITSSGAGGLLTVKRALVLDNGRIRQATDSYLNFIGNFKPLVFINGVRRLRRTTEGTPLVMGENNKIRQITSSENLLIPPTLSTFSYDNAAVAVFSTRKWIDGYTGNALNVRRSSDSTTLDIGYLPDGNLDIYSMVNFVGAMNLTTKSEAFDTWTLSNVTVNANAEVAPNYTKTADLVSNTPSVNSQLSNNNATLSTSTAYTHSCFAKAISGNGQLFFEMYTGTAWNSAGFDLINGVASTSGITSATMTYVNNGWWRCSAVYTTASSGTPAAGTIYIGAYGNTPTPTTVALWGNQLHTTATLLDYCQTSASAQSTSNSGFVAKWYDQSGKVNDLSQATTTAQPRIVNAGVIDSINGKPAVRTDGTAFFMKTGSFAMTNLVTRSSVLQFNKISAGNIFDSQTAPSVELLFSVSGTLSMNAGTSNSVKTSVSINDIATVMEVFNGASSTGSYNGASTATATVGTNVETGLVIGASTAGSNFGGASYGEVILFPNALSTANQSLLQINQKTYWNTS